MRERLDRLRAELGRLGAAAFLVSAPVNVRYLVGFASSNAMLLLGPARVLLLTDGRYIEAARSVPGVEALEIDRELAPALGGRLGGLAPAPVAFEADHLTVARHAAIAASGVELVATEGVVAGLRAVKEPAELDAVRRAAAVLDRVFERVAAGPMVGSTEADVAWSILEAIHAEGGDGPAFPPIVAAGPNAALPHHSPTRRRIEPRETVIVDAGVEVDGYCSDCTRTFATGPLPEDLERAYALCRSAQAHALEAVRAGAGASEVDSVARREIQESGLAEVLHGLGHGVGLEIHELPRLSLTSTAVLEADNVVTVEPGVYLPGRGGVRIEDLVVVGEDGAEVLTPFTRDLVTVA